MNVGSLLEVYTTMWGWSVYNIMFDLFRETGLILFPFLVVIIRNWKEPMMSQNDKAASSVSLSRMMIQSGLMIGVLMVAVVPVVGLDVNQVSYRVACTDSAGGTDVLTDVAGGGTGTTYDTQLADISDVQIPIVLMSVLSIGAGVNAAISSSFQCFEDIKGLDEQLRNLTIKDQELRQEYFRFANECFLPAKSKFVKARYGGNYHDYVETKADAFLATPASTTALWMPERDDFFFIGSYFYQNTPGFYREFNLDDCDDQPGGCGQKARTGVSDWPVNQSRDMYSQERIDDPDPDNPLYGKPFCDEWWSDSARGLRGKLLNSVEASTVYRENEPGSNFTESFLTWASNTYTAVVYNDNQLEDIVIKRYVAEDPPTFLEDKGGLFFGGNQWADIHYSTAAQNVEKLGAAAATLSATALASRGKFSAVTSGLSGAAKSFAGQLGDFYANMIIAKQAAPMVQAVLLMAVYMLLLIYFIMTDFDYEAVIRISFLLLAFQFFTSLWNLADYLDARLFVSMYPDALMLGSLYTHGPNRLILDIVLTILYVVMPWLLLWIMNTAGSRTGNFASSMGSLGRPGSTGMGSSFLGKSTTKMGAAKSNSLKKM